MSLLSPCRVFAIVVETRCIRFESDDEPAVNRMANSARRRAAPMERRLARILKSRQRRTKVAL